MFFHLSVYVEQKLLPTIDSKFEEEKRLEIDRMREFIILELIFITSLLSKQKDNIIL